MEKSIGIKYVEAIKAINPNWSSSIVGNTEEELVIDWNGEAEISVADIQAKISELETAETAKATAKANAKVSGNAKLLTLGLSQEEATALTGFTPSED
tara:strand:+ start:593 stop:886 length:294 start_codon:yes stop_codon:yes gene_type:complete